MRTLNITNNRNKDTNLLMFGFFLVWVLPPPNKSTFFLLEVKKIVASEGTHSSYHEWGLDISWWHFPLTPQS